MGQSTDSLPLRGLGRSISDGTAAVVVMSAEAAERAGVRALAEIGTHGNVTGPDNSLHSQPSNAIRQGLSRAGRTVSDLDLIEINEALAIVAIQSMAIKRRPPIQIDYERLAVGSCRQVAVMQITPICMLSTAGGAHASMQD